LSPSVFVRTIPASFKAHLNSSLSKVPLLFLSYLLKNLPADLIPCTPLFFKSSLILFNKAVGAAFYISNTGFKLGVFPLPIVAIKPQNSSKHNFPERSVSYLLNKA